MAMVDTHFTNAELASIYDYLTGHITQAQLGREIGRARTNTYYYIGRAVQYWVANGMLKFNQVKEARDLGGNDVK